MKVSDFMSLKSHIERMKQSLFQKQPKKAILSVVVCTYNRENLLPECLESLAVQQVDTKRIEIIVVDNNSNDNTRNIIDGFVKKHSNFKYVFEPTQGLSHARNLGLKVTTTDYIAYIDDDARVGKDWLKKALEIINEKQPDIFGGPVYPLFPEGKPRWFKNEYGVRGDMGETGWLKKGFIIGTNIFFKKSLLTEYGGFDPNLGMTGDHLAYGEETHIVYRALKENKKVYYSKELAVKDHLPEYKKSLAFFIYSKYQIGKDLQKLHNESFDKSNVDVLIKLMDKTFSELELALNRKEDDSQQYPYPENYIIEKLRNNFIGMGRRMGFYLKNSQQELNVNHQPPSQQVQIQRVIKKLEVNNNLILELGVGDVERSDEWITLDKNTRADINHDLRYPFPLPDASFNRIYCSHLLEHFYHNELMALLKEVSRVLKSRGVFSICVPDASLYINAFTNSATFDSKFYCRHKPSFNFYSKIDYINYMAYMNGHHKMMFDLENLPKILEKAGFNNIQTRIFDPVMDLKKRDYESIYFTAEK